MTSVLERAANTFRLARLSLGETGVAYLPEERLRERQSARFRALVRHAYEYVPYYREWLRAAGAEPGDLRTVADLRRLPLVDKLDLALHPERFASSAYASRDGLTLLSSGTSGRLRSFRHDTQALFESFAAGRRQRLVLRQFIGKETAYREAVFKRQGSAGDQIRHFWENRMWNPRSLDLTRRLFSPAQAYPDLLAAVNEFRPQVYRGIGSHLGAFLRWVCETERHFERPKVVTYGADAMTANDRRLIEADLGIPVVSTYQAVEALRIGFQCEVRKGFHISIDKVDVRVVDPSGVDVAPGERGQLILTNLINRATVVMNYRLGDLVTQSTGQCACGRTLPLIADIDGRLDDLIDRPGGTRLHALTILPRLQAIAGLTQVQVVQNALDEFALKVVWASGATPMPADLRTQMAAVLGDQIRVSVEAVDRLPQEPSGKVKSVISDWKGR
ncbi:hypothetical protein [uncultured Paludibaculum sp.]|uniref:phenylacetate--CoA ligase family protein n=1 Tax=uncultured Paludibaculum sp. TaxID=1765020 RepID=UPI002AAB7E22|nr:hypothetical protein [uncultured Paludibaculum sp.]